MPTSRQHSAETRLTDMIEWALRSPQNNTAILYSPTRRGAEIETLPTWAMRITRVDERFLLTCCVSGPFQAAKPYQVTRWIEQFTGVDALSAFLAQPSVLATLGFSDVGDYADITWRWEDSRLDRPDDFVEREEAGDGSEPTI